MRFIAACWFLFAGTFTIRPNSTASVLHVSYTKLNCSLPSAMLLQHHCSHGISFV